MNRHVPIGRPEAPRSAAPGARCPVVIHGAGITHRGCVRAANEDAILTDPDCGIWAVADGMGGHGHGDVAAGIVIDHLTRLCHTSHPLDALCQALAAANMDMIAQAPDPDTAQMGATVVAAVIDDTAAHIAWAGDSRAYLMRRGRLRQVTRDHSIVQDMVDQGLLTMEEARTHPGSHVITRAIGGGAALDLDDIAVPVTSGDRLLLCSDGLCGPLPDARIAEVLALAPAPRAACETLLHETLQAGAPDNISAIVVDVL